MAPNTLPPEAAHSVTANGEPRAPQANGNHHKPSGSTKKGHAFHMETGTWTDRTIADDNVYSKRRIDCSEEEWKTRVDLAAAYRLCHRHGFNEGISNHLSMRVPGTTDRFLTFPYGLMWTEVTASNLLLIDESARVVNGIGEPEATAFWIHAPIHFKHPDAACIMHTHQAEITALCALEDPELPMIQQSCQFFYDDIVVDSYNGLVLDQSEGDHLAEVMGSKHVLMHQNHGVMVTGTTVHETWDRLYYLEQAARIANKALAIGRPLRIIPDQVCIEFSETYGKVRAEYARLHFEARKRELLKTEDRDFLT